MSDLLLRLRAMPSSLNDACRTMDTAADRIETLEAALQKIADVQKPGEAARISQLDDASNACLELAAKHGYATGHGDTVADMIREFSAQIEARAALQPSLRFGKASDKDASK